MRRGGFASTNTTLCTSSMEAGGDVRLQRVPRYSFVAFHRGKRAHVAMERWREGRSTPFVAAWREDVRDACPLFTGQKHV